MAQIKTNDFPDLDVLINAADNGARIGGSSGEANRENCNGAFDPDEYADMVKWYNEQSQNIQQHYDVHLEYQKQKLAEENEAGLLEALQQSLDNIESDHMSDLACLSSSLDQVPTFHPILDNGRPSAQEEEEKEKSMLKKLLLSPMNISYGKAVNSPPSSDLAKGGDTLKARTTLVYGKNETSKKKKPFTELLKHMKAAEGKANDKDGKDARPKNGQKNGIRCVNAKRYMRKYSSEPASPVASQTVNVANNSKVSSDTGVNESSSNTTKQAVRIGKEKLVLVSSVAPPVISRNGTSYSRTVQKRRAEPVSIEHPDKRPRTASTDTLGASNQSPPCSVDHNYCTSRPESAVTTSANAHSRDCSVSNSDVSVMSDAVGQPPAEAESKQKQELPTKILKWQDYLQRVRAGTRSAPNSPSTSPKVIRGSARAPNNFMIVSMQQAQKHQTSKVVMNSSVSIIKRKPICPIIAPVPKPLCKKTPKNVVKLQGFEEYMTVLQSNLSAPDADNKKTMKETDVANFSLENAPATNALTALIQRQNCDKEGKAAEPSMAPMVEGPTRAPTSTPSSSASQIIKIGKKMRYLQTDVNGNKMINVRSTPASGTTGQMLFIHVPSCNGDSTSVPIVHNVISTGNQIKQLKHNEDMSPSPGDAAAMLTGGVTECEQVTVPDPRLVLGERKCTTSPVKDLLIPGMMKSRKGSKEDPSAKRKGDTGVKLKSGTATQKKAVFVKPKENTNSQTPTFKLVTKTNPKGGVEPKSLILSGVTGPLKEILTLLAKQQADSSQNQNASGASNSAMQQLTLDKLLSLLGSATTTAASKPTAVVMPQPKVSVVSSSACGKTESVSQHRVWPRPSSLIAGEKSPAKPSSLSLIHEIKQNICKQEQNLGRAVDTVDGRKSQGASTEDGGPGQSPAGKIVAVKTPDDLKQGGGPTLSQGPEMKDQIIPKMDDNNAEKVQKLSANELVSSQVEYLVAPPVETTPTYPAEEPAVLNSDVSELEPPGENDNLPESNPPSAVPSRDAEAPFVVINSDVSPIPPDVATQPTLVSPTDCKGPPAKFSMARSMAAAEMLASNVFDDGVQEMLVYDRPKLKTFDNNNNTMDDPDPAVITLEDGLACIEEDEILSNENKKTITLSTADKLFCKLPSYFLTGKLIPEIKEEKGDSWQKSGMKDLECDPMMFSREESESDREIQFNKLPHYFSCGKQSGRPSKRKLKSPHCKNGQAVKLSSAGDCQLTSNGVPVNPSEIYYSRLPTYYSYGRPHPALKTFNDAVADHKDDTITPEQLSMEAARLDKSEGSRGRETRSRRKGKRKKKSSKDRESCEVLYSKLPSYYLNREPRNRNFISKSQSRGKDRHCPSSSSPSSSDSLYYSSESSRSRSRSWRKRRRSRSQRNHHHRHNSKSMSSPVTSSSSSRSRSRSPHYARGPNNRSRRRERSLLTRREKMSRNISGEENDRRCREREDWNDARKKQVHKEKLKQQSALEERRVVYVGRIDDSTTKNELRLRFIRFGTIEAVSLHFRENGDNYGFVTFQYTCDAFRAIEEGNSSLGPNQPIYELSFGGRRQFCKAEYEDLDSRVDGDEMANNGDVDDFDALLRRAKRSLHN